MTTGGLLPLLAVLATQALPPTPGPDSSAVVATVEAFHAALAAGDSVRALELLAPDAIVLESGDLETRAEYAAHHLGADIAFTQAVPSRRVTTLVRVDGNAAWVAATSISEGDFRGRPVNSQGVELMVLSRTGIGWRIRAIHWSSRRR